MLRSYWSLIVIVGLGFLLRIALVVVSPPNLANDNHLDPIGIIVREGRIARPDECAQCYQPPLYYLICSGVYVIAERIQIERGANSSVAMITGFKAVQTVSAMAGTLTLLVCAFILRSTLKVTSHVEWLSLGVIALLPRHLYMSAMITNDALTYLAATLAIYFFLRTRTVGYSWSGCLLTGLTSGTAILSKGYGLVTTGIIVFFFFYDVIIRRRGCKKILQADIDNTMQKNSTITCNTLITRRRFPDGMILFAWLVIPCLLVSAWPFARNMSLYGKPHVDNFELFPGPIQNAPPGRVESIHYFTFRPDRLLSRPWIHMDTVNEFWTQLFARYWFDYEGINCTLALSPAWQLHQASVSRSYAVMSRDWWRELLNWHPNDVPAQLIPVSVATYSTGLILTILIVTGLLVSLRNRGSQFFLTLHGIGCLLVPIFQSLRLPHFSAMKAEFTLCALCSIPIWLALLGTRFHKRIQTAFVVMLALCCMVLLFCDVLHIRYIASQAKPLHSF